jgi:hypothetical protein
MFGYNHRQSPVIFDRMWQYQGKSPFFVVDTWSIVAIALNRGERNLVQEKSQQRKTSKFIRLQSVNFISSIEPHSLAKWPKGGKDCGL